VRLKANQLLSHLLSICVNKEQVVLF